MRTRGEWPPPGATDKPSRALNWIGDEAVTNDRLWHISHSGCVERAAPALHVAELSAGFYVPFPLPSDGFRYVLSHG